MNEETQEFWIQIDEANIYYEELNSSFHMFIIVLENEDEIKTTGVIAGDSFTAAAFAASLNPGFRVVNTISFMEMLTKIKGVVNETFIDNNPENK